MTTTRKILTIIVLLTALSACTIFGKRVDRYVPQSEFVFVGTILQVNTSTIGMEEVDDLAIVRVDEILDAATPFLSTQSQVITIQLRNPKRIKPDQRLIFFTRGWHFGESLGVVEVGHLAALPAKEAERLREDILRVRREQADRELKQRLERAEFIISGRVIAVRKADIQVGLTEHDPEWHEADIDVGKVLKGQIGQPRFTILFPRSTDVMWYRAPKYEPGMEGLWILRPIEFAGERLRFPTALDRNDFYPFTELPTVERLLDN